ncbi:DUF2510 domain-containing protein [Streptomyces sp. BG9H]|uniref:DUF2510 domain-containing protein n=1 Tax=Streptomyces anatolicus TaxID=2675858 RepID=A0ABS6YWU8_9ACTN|nr:DUF2510 domain-containing protein [Streptomyces anatolicus]MBW5425928.1 DUF2510 domain-containing protein [Streptomyces anatolicus]
MTQMTPPGWYPDPGQVAGGPPTERWWDGNVWTDQVRTAGAHAYPTQAAFPAHPGQDPAPRRGLRVAIAVGVVLVVLAGIGGGVYALTADDDGGEGDSSAKEPSTGAPKDPGNPRSPDAPRSPEGPQDPKSPEQDPGFANDSVSGIKIPVPDGWRGVSTRFGAAVQTEPIPCPGNPQEQCTRGSAYSQPAEKLDIDAKTPEAAAKADIKRNAKEGYGGKTYGRITSHKVLASKSITVAGQKGYHVRWKAITQKSDDGYVESLAFPSPADKSKLVIIRMGIDDNDQAPSPSTMDKIVKGIEAGSAGGGAGAGQDV